MTKFIDTLFAIVVIFTITAWAVIVPVRCDGATWGMLVIVRAIMVAWLAYVVFRHEARKDHWQ